MRDICIVGAGVSGLTLAYSLGRNGAEILLKESASRVGGAIRTVAQDGFLLEYGPSSVLVTPNYHTLLHELGLEDDVVSPLPGGTTRLLAQKNSVGDLTLVPMPSTPLAMVLSRLLSTPAKLRIFADPFISPSGAEDESIHAFFCRRLGAEFAQNIVAPLISGIWAASARELSIRCSMPKVWQTEQRYRSVILPLLLSKVFASHSDSPKSRGAISFIRGMEQLTTRLRESLSNTQIVLSSEASTAELLAHEKLFLTTSARHCSSVLRERHPALSNQIAELPTSPVGILYLAIPQKKVKHPLKAFGFLVPSVYRQKLRAVIFNSSVFPGRAPAGFHLLTCYLGTDPTDSAEQSSVLEELDQLIGISAPPLILDAVYLPHALPRYPVGHRVLQQELEKFNSTQERIRIVASWYKGLSVAQRVGEALMAKREARSDSPTFMQLPAT